MNLKSIRRDLEVIKESCNSNGETIYDFIRKHPNNYLLFFQPYLRKQGVDYMSKINRTSDLLECPELESYRRDFEAEARLVSVKDALKR